MKEIEEFTFRLRNIKISREAELFLPSISSVALFRKATHIAK